MFETEQSLKTCINYLNAIGDKNLDAFEKSIGYKSFRSTNQDTSIIIEDDILSTLMNPNRQIIICGYVITTNIKDRTSTLTPLKASDLKSSNTSYTLNWNVDMYDFIENGCKISTLKSGYCGNTDEKKEWDFSGQDTMFGNDGNRIQAKVCFQRATWYNSIIIKFKYERAINNNGWNINFNLHYKTQEAWYRARNRSTTHFSRENSCYATKQGDEISHRPYSSTRRVEASVVPVYFDYELFFGDNFIEKDGILLTMSCT